MSSSPGRTFTIRPATHEDMRAVVGIYNWAINQTFATIDSEPLSAEEAEEWWDAHTRQEMLTLRHPTTVWNADFSPDGTRVVTCCDDGGIRIWYSDQRAGEKQGGPP